MVDPHIIELMIMSVVMSQDVGEPCVALQLHRTNPVTKETTPVTFTASQEKFRLLLRGRQRLEWGQLKVTKGNCTRLHWELHVRVPCMLMSMHALVSFQDPTHSCDHDQKGGSGNY